MNDNPCCATCRGQAPYHFCKYPPRDHLTPGCTCHQWQEAVAHKRYNALTYKDTTARKAINNVMKGLKK